MAFDLIAHLKLVDNMTAPLRSLTSGLVGFGTKVAGVTVAVAGLGSAVSAVAIASNAAKKAMDFESELSTIQALTGATADEMLQMQQLALKMGADTKYNAQEAAQGIEELLKAGLSPATVQAGGLEAALNLATAGELGLADAAEIMSTALNAYKKDGMSAAEASNILAGTANASATGVEELRQSLSAVSAVAAGVGLSFRDTNDALGVFANNGLKGSDAGTSLKTMLQNLQPTTKQQVALFKALGLMTKNGANAFYDAHGNIKSLESIAGTLRKSMSKLTNQQRQLALETMFGTDAVRAATILYNEGAEGVKEFDKEMSKVTALDVAKKKMDNAAGAVEQFRGAIETLQISALMPTMPLIKDFANKAADLVTRYTPEITAATKRMTDRVKTYLKNHFTNNPEFNKITTLEGKIKFVFDDIMKTFRTWYDGGGRDKVTKISEDIVNTLSEALQASQPLIDAAIKIGSAVAEGVIKGLMTTIEENPTAARIFLGITGASMGSRFGPYGALALGAAGVMAPDMVSAVQDWQDQSKPTYDKINSTIAGSSFKQDLSKPLWKQLLPGFATGLDRVPYDDFPARLHEGEMVLTKEQAARYREGESSSSRNVSNRSSESTQRGGNVTITGNTFVIREESDIDKLAARLAYHLAG